MQRPYENRLKDEVPKLHPVADMGINEPPMEKLLARETQLQSRLEELPFHEDQDREEQLQRYSSVSLHLQINCTYSRAYPDNVLADTAVLRLSTWRNWR